MLVRSMSSPSAAPALNARRGRIVRTTAQSWSVPRSADDRNSWLRALAGRAAGLARTDAIDILTLSSGASRHKISRCRVHRGRERSEVTGYLAQRVLAFSTSRRSAGRQGERHAMMSSSACFRIAATACCRNRESRADVAR
jgi:hypothetical protein